MSNARPDIKSDNQPSTQTNVAVLRQLPLIAGTKILDAIAVPNTNAIIALEGKGAEESTLVKHELDEEKNTDTTSEETIPKLHNQLYLFPSSQRAMTHGPTIDGHMHSYTWDLTEMHARDPDIIDRWYYPTTVTFGDCVYLVAVHETAPDIYQPNCVNFADEQNSGDGSGHPLTELPHCVAAIPNTNEFLVGGTNECTQFAVTGGALAKINTFAVCVGTNPITAIGVAAAIDESEVITNSAATAVTTPPVMPAGQIVITGSQSGMLQTWRRTLSHDNRPPMQALSTARLEAQIDYLMPIPGYSFAMAITGRHAYWADLACVENSAFLDRVVLANDYKNEKRKCSFTNNTRLVTPYGELIDATSYPDKLLRTAAEHFNHRMQTGTPGVTAVMLKYFGTFPAHKVSAASTATLEVIAEIPKTTTLKK